MELEKLKEELKISQDNLQKAFDEMQILIKSSKPNERNIQTD